MPWWYSSFQFGAGRATTSSCQALYPPGLSPAMSPGLMVSTQTRINTFSVVPTFLSPALSPYLSFLRKSKPGRGPTATWAWPGLEASAAGLSEGQVLSPAPSLPVTALCFYKAVDFFEGA